MVRVVEQLCKNIETAIAVCYPNSKDTDSVSSPVKDGGDSKYTACFITMVCLQFHNDFKRIFELGYPF